MLSFVKVGINFANVGMPEQRDTLNASAEYNLFSVWVVQTNRQLIWYLC